MRQRWLQFVSTDLCVFSLAAAFFCLGACIPGGPPNQEQRRAVRTDFEEIRIPSRADASGVDGGRDGGDADGEAGEGASLDVGASPILVTHGGAICAIVANGSIRCSGAEGVTTVEGVERAIGLAGNDAHGCALTERGHLWCWPWDGARPGRARQVRWVRHARDVALSPELACVAIADGTVVCWSALLRGLNGEWTVGEGASRLPLRLPWLREVAALHAVGEAICARDRAGAVFCWGSELLERASRGDFLHALMPEGVEAVWSGGASRAFAFAGRENGGARLCVALDDGELRCRAFTLGAPPEPWLERSLPGEHPVAVDGSEVICSLSERRPRCLRYRDPSAPSVLLESGPEVRQLVGGRALCGITDDRRLSCWGHPGDSGLEGELVRQSPAERRGDRTRRDSFATIWRAIESELRIMGSWPELGELARQTGPFLPLTGVETPTSARPPHGGRCFPALGGAKLVPAASADDDPELRRVSLQITPYVPLAIDENKGIVGPLVGHVDRRSRMIRHCEADVRQPPPAPAPALASSPAKALRDWANGRRPDGPLVRPPDLPTAVKREVERLLSEARGEATKMRWLRPLTPTNGTASPTLVVSGEFDLRQHPVHRRVVDGGAEQRAEIPGSSRGIMIALMTDAGEVYQVVDALIGRMHEERPWALASSSDVDGDGHPDTILVAADYGEGQFREGFVVAMSGWLRVSVVPLLHGSADGAALSYQGGCFGLVDGRPAYLVFLRRPASEGGAEALGTVAFVADDEGMFHWVDRLYGQVAGTGLRPTFFAPEHPGMDTWHERLMPQRAGLCGGDGEFFDIVSNDIEEGAEQIPRLSSQPLVRLWRLATTEEGVGRDFAVIRLHTLPPSSSSR